MHSLKRETRMKSASDKGQAVERNRPKVTPNGQHLIPVLRTTNVGK